MAHTPGTAVIPVAASAAAARRGRARRPASAHVVLDDVSKLIIEQLQQDGRRSYAAIGKAVGLSEAAVRQRVQRLIDGGVMQIFTKKGYDRRKKLWTFSNGSTKR